MLERVCYKEHPVVLDALCETEDGKEFNVEVQKADEDDGSDVAELIILWGFW